MSCIFCKIASGEIPSDKVYEDKDILAFRDVNPQAPEHILVIPKKHIVSLNDISDDESDIRLVGRIFLCIKKIATRTLKLENGYRVVLNTGADAGQAVPHIHFHILGKRKLNWPPG